MLIFQFAIHSSTKCLKSEKWKHLTDILQVQDPYKVTENFFFLSPWRSKDALIYSHDQTVPEHAASLKQVIFKATIPAFLSVH